MYILKCPVCGEQVVETEDKGSWAATRDALPPVFRCGCGRVATAEGRTALLNCLQDMLSIDPNSWVEHDGIRHPCGCRDPKLYPPTQPRVVMLRAGKEPPTA